MKIIIRILLSTIAVLVADLLLSGVHAVDLKTGLLVAIVLGLLNAVVRYRAHVGPVRAGDQCRDGASGGAHRAGLHGERVLVGTGLQRGDVGGAGHTAEAGRRGRAGAIGAADPAAPASLGHPWE